MPLWLQIEKASWSWKEAQQELEEEKTNTQVERQQEACISASVPLPT